MVDNDYLKELHKRLMNEQFSMTAASKLHEQEFVDLLQCAVYFMEKDDMMIWVDDPKLDALLSQTKKIYETMKNPSTADGCLQDKVKVDPVEAMKDITGI